MTDASGTCPTCFSCTAVLRIPLPHWDDPSSKPCSDSWHDEHYDQHNAEIDAAIAAVRRAEQ